MLSKRHLVRFHFSLSSAWAHQGDEHDRPTWTLGRRWGRPCCCRPPPASCPRSSPSAETSFAQRLLCAGLKRLDWMILLLCLLMSNHCTWVMEVITLGKCFLLGVVVVVLVAKRFHLATQILIENLADRATGKNGWRGQFKMKIVETMLQRWHFRWFTISSPSRCSSKSQSWVLNQVNTYIFLC